MAEQIGIIARITESVTSVGGAIKSAVGAAKEIQEMKIDYEVKEKTHELLSKLMDVQQQQMSLQELLMSAKDRIIELENEKKYNENWEAEAAKYELYQAMSGTLVYRLKSSEQIDQVPVYLCPACYELKKKSILQTTGAGAKPRIGVVVDMGCSQCKASYMFSRNAFPRIIPTEREESPAAITDYDPYK